MPIGTRGLVSYWQDWANLVLGVWLFVAPWVLGYAGHTAPAWNSWIMGTVVVAVAAAALIHFAVWEEWLNAICGLWLLVAPWVMGFAGADAAAALWNHVLVGLGIGILALWDALAHGAQDRVPV
jgi:hypothetical protein